MKKNCVVYWNPGSPPPMRGKVEQNRFQIHHDGITPAYAGKRHDSLTVCFFLKDHPRLCGEKLSDFSMIAKVLGSPPPMRGKVKLMILSGVVHVDHPRLCGEKSFFSSSVFISLGSPPPMRGKANLLIVNATGARITPAYAGKRHSIRNPLICQ